jgi:hypothetical protein
MLERNWRCERSFPVIRKRRFLAAVLLVLFQLSRPAISATVGFKPAVNYPVGTRPRAVATGDFNSDGKPDLAVANSGDTSGNDDGSVSILLGNGDGTFQPANNIAAGKNPGSIAVGDFNGDNRLDVVVTTGNHTVSVLLGNGDGTFQTHVDYATGIGPNSVATGDFNGDGRLDLVVANSGSGSVSVLLGNGDGTFRPHVDYSGTGRVISVAVADFNGDGRVDLAVAGGSISGIVASGVVAILLGNGDGTFQSAVSYDTSGIFGTSVAVGDFNGDSKLDLVVRHVGNLSGSKVDLLPGNGDGTFSQGSPLATTGCPAETLFADDFDGDSRLDVAVLTEMKHDGVCIVGSTLSVLVFAGNGDGTFQAPASFTSANAENLGATADLDGDKSPDLVTVNSDNTISVLLNSTGAEFSITASAPSPPTVSRGQSSTSTLTLNHLNAFDDPVTLACSVQPTQSAPTCSLNMTSVTFDANGNATATLTINTGAASASLVPSFLRQDSRPLQLLWLPVAGLAFMGAGVSRSSSSKRRLLGFLVGCVLFAGLILQAACGGGSSSSPTSQTYTITVTGTSGSTQHSTTTTLTVQ